MQMPLLSKQLPHFLKMSMKMGVQPQAQPQSESFHPQGLRDLTCKVVSRLPLQVTAKCTQSLLQDAWGRARLLSQIPPALPFLLLLCGQILSSPGCSPGGGKEPERSASPT